MNWLAAGRIDSIRYVRVKWPSMAEVSEIQGVTACRVSENSLSTLKVSGELSFASNPMIGDDLVRVYSDSILGSEKATVCHATLFLTTPKTTYSSVSSSGVGNMYSVLWILQQNRVEGAYSVDAGVEAVTLAADLARGYGNSLQVIVTPSQAKTTTMHTWDDGTDYLTIVNDLLEIAGYASATVDGYGNVIMAPYTDPAGRAVAATFSDAIDSVSAPSFEADFDIYEVPNVISITCSNATEEPLKSVVENDDPENPYSTVSRGKRIVRSETVSDIANQAALDAKARELLVSSMSQVEAATVEHSYQPFEMGDAVLIDYWGAGYSRKMTAVARDIELVPGIRCKTRTRRFANLLKE